MARHGKIARLPKWLRDTLNIKLRDGESGVAVVAWLKALWETNEVVADAVGEEPVNEQNLSAWRQGGYRDWERRQGAAELVHELAEHAQDLKQEAAGREVSDRLSTVLTGELARVAEAMLAETTSPRERWELLKEVLRELTRVRQMDHRASKQAREQADWEQARQQAKARQAGPGPVAAAEELQHKKLWGTICAASLANKKGATESDRVVAAAMAESVFGLPLGTIDLSVSKVGQASRLSSDGTIRSAMEEGPGEAGGTHCPTSGEEAEPVAPEADKGESSKIKENQEDRGKCGMRSAECGMGTEEKTPPSSDFGAASEEEEGAGAPTVNLAPGVPQEVWGRQFAADGTLLPPGVHWQFPRRPIQAGVPDKMILVNAAGEEVGPDGQPMPVVDEAGDEGGTGLRQATARQAHRPAVDEAGSSKIKENQGGPETQAEEPPEEWEDGGWMKKRSRKGG